MKTVLNTEADPSRAEIAGMAIEHLKQADEAFWLELVKRMADDELFRRRVLSKAIELGKGKRGSWVPPKIKTNAVRLARELLMNAIPERDVLAMLETAFVLTRRQSKPLLKAAAASMPGRRIYRFS